VPFWEPHPAWQDRDVFIIGGGDSLRVDNFDWTLLHDECTIGCNCAFMLGEKVCKICIFGDYKWFDAFKHQLMKYKGLIFTNSPHMYKSTLPWLWLMNRQNFGLGTGDYLCWCKNTGAAAINLALILGAKRVLLLGFDMKLSKNGKPNWHDHRIEPTKSEVYEKFIKDFRTLHQALPEKFSNSTILNVTDDSELPYFEKVGVKEFFKERKRK
jgi:hypothetical protein